MRDYFNPLALELDIYRTKKGNIRKYTTFCGGINQDGESIKYN